MGTARATTRTLARIALAILAIGMPRPATADGPLPAAPPTAEARADAVVAASRSADGSLARLAAAPEPDAWLVADALFARGAAGEARAFAAAVLGVDAAALRAWVDAAAVSVLDDAAPRRALAAAEETLRGHDPAGALASACAVEANGAVLAVRLERLRATALLALSRPAEAAARFARAGERAESLGWRAWAAQTFGEAGSAASAAGDPDLAARSFDRAAAAAAARGDAATEADALTGLGRVRQQQGDLPGALGTLRRALALRSRHGSPPATATTLRALGLVHEDAGAYEEARDAQPVRSNSSDQTT